MSSLVQALRRASARLSRGARRCSSTAAEAPSHPVVRSDSHGFHPEHLNEIPAGFAHAPLVLGVAGAIPFVALAAPVRPLLDDYVPSALFPAARSAEYQAKYGAAILSFLGGMHWGWASGGFAGAGADAFAKTASEPARRAALLAGPARFAYGVVPSLVAWAALAMPLPQQLAAVSLSLVAALGADAAFASERMMPRWLMPLRFGLTGTAAVCLLASVPAAIEAQREELKREAENRELRRRAPKTREALATRERSLAAAEQAAAKAREEIAALEAALAKADRRAVGAEAELRLTQGAREAEAAAAEARRRSSPRRRRRRARSSPPRDAGGEPGGGGGGEARDGGGGASCRRGEDQDRGRGGEPEGRGGGGDAADGRVAAAPREGRMNEAAAREG